MPSNVAKGGPLDTTHNTYWFGELAWQRKGWHKCIEIDLIDEKASHDSRFVTTGLEISEYELQAENGIMSNIQNRLHWDATIFPSFQPKTEVINTVY